MRIVVAPDKFKSSLDAHAAAEAIANGLRQAAAEVELDLCPVADGGEGTVAVLGGTLVDVQVTGPLPEMKVTARYSMIPDRLTAVIEMAAASGLRLLPPDQRNPLHTTTFGSGELLMAAVERGARHIILGIGGSATIDCGIGCAQACGLPVLMRDGEPTAMTEPLVGGDLDRVLMIKHGRGSRIEHCDIVVACDVDNPLYGPHGAAMTFGLQKGAAAEKIPWFDEQLARIARQSGKDDIAKMPGAGAAGGLGFAMAAFFGATLRSGFDLVAEWIGLENRLKGADLCITGEGRLDEDSLRGKAAMGVARMCRRAGVPCIALVGSAGAGAAKAIAEGLTAWFSIADGPMTLEQSMQSAPALLSRAAFNLLRFKLSKTAVIE